MESMESMPTYTYAIIGGVVVLMLLMIVIGMRRSFARARGTAQDFFAGLERLGLKKTKQDGAKTELGGNYRGRDVAMYVDGSAVSKAGNKAMRSSLFSTAKELGNIGGIGSFGDDEDDDNDDIDDYEEDDEQEEQEERNESVQKAAMLVRWSVALPESSPFTIRIGRDRKAGEEIGAKIYAKFDEQARAGMTDPQVISALSEAQFNSISVSDTQAVCTWSPPMKEYQKYSNDAFAQVSQRALDALCAMCDSLYGPAA